MPKFILESGEYYEFISGINPRYASRIAEFFKREFTNLEEIIREAEKICGKDSFSLPEITPNTPKIKHIPVRYSLLGAKIEVARIRIVE